MTTSPPQRGRPRKKPRSVGRPRKSGNSRGGKPIEEILKAASVLFSTKGYAGTTMAEIAEMVGIRGPSLYYHFELKSDILRGIAKLAITQTVEISERVDADETLELPVKLYQLLFDTVMHLRSSPYELNFLFDPVFEEPEFKDLNSQIVLYLKVLRKVLRTGTDAGFFAVKNIDVTAQIVLGLIASTIRKSGRFKNIPDEDVAYQMADFASRAILVPGADLERIRAHAREDGKSA